ncbi:hypothetical protein AB0392_10575 [Nonomuraea angiospora]|uniref:hypothetical protein n=1 Tax=Nonomuraea angiospora TaxID=46172 RepID=UPI00344FDEDA
MTAGDDLGSQTWCPSGPADSPESVVLGVHAGESEDLSYVASPVPAAEVIGLLPSDIDPARVLRFASHCRDECAHRRENRCSLIDRIMILEPPAGDHTVPRCHLRPRCTWWTQVGVEACRRCPFVTRAIRGETEREVLIADPATTQEQLDAYIAGTAHADHQ